MFLFVLYLTRCYFFLCSVWCLACPLFFTKAQGHLFRPHPVLSGTSLELKQALNMKVDVQCTSSRCSFAKQYGDIYCIWDNFQLTYPQREQKTRLETLKTKFKKLFSFLGHIYPTSNHWVPAISLHLKLQKRKNKTRLFKWSKRRKRRCNRLFPPGNVGHCYLRGLWTNAE